MHRSAANPCDVLYGDVTSRVDNVNIKLTSCSPVCFVAIVDFESARCNAMCVKVTIITVVCLVVSLDAESQVSVNLAALFSDKLLHTIGHIAGVSPREVIVPLKHCFAVRNLRCDK